MLAGMLDHLRHLRCGNIFGIHATDASSFSMDFEHDYGRLFKLHSKKNLAALRPQIP